MVKKKNQVLMAVVGIALILVAWLFVSNAQAAQGSYMDITVYYQDGTSRTLSPGLYKYPLEIYDPANSKLVEAINVNLHMVATFEGPVNSYAVTGNIQWGLFETNNVFIAPLGQVQPISYSGGILHSGDDVVVFSQRFDMVGSDGVESLYGGWIDGHEYAFEVYSTVEMTVTLNFGDPQNPTPMTRTVMPNGVAWVFRYDYPFAFTSVSASWTGLPEYSPYI